MSKQNSSKVRPSTRKTNTPAPALRSFEGRSAFEAAYEKRLVEIERVASDELAANNLDVHAAVATVLGCLPEIARYRREMSKLHGLDQDKIDSLEEYAQAAAEAHSRWIAIVTRPDDIVALHAKGRAMRALLRSDARALAQRGLLSRSQVAAFRGHVGYKNVAFDLIDWANLLRDHWGSIQGKTPLTEEDVRQAKALGEQMIRAVGLREQAPVLQRSRRPHPAPGADPPGRCLQRDPPRPRVLATEPGRRGQDRAFALRGKDAQGRKRKADIAVVRRLNRVPSRVVRVVARDPIQPVAASRGRTRGSPAIKEERGMKKYELRNETGT